MANWQEDLQNTDVPDAPAPASPASTPNANAGGGNWVQEIQALANQTGEVSYPSPAESISDQIAAMPNSDKLTGTERWLYEKLPGFSQSSIGKALESFSASPAGKILNVLDVAAEGLERTFGLLVQWRDQNPGDQFKLEQAWEAGSLFYDVSKMPHLKYDEEGNIVGVQIDEEMPGTYALTEARKLLESGKTLEEVRDTLYGNMGALALRAQLQDTWGHSLGDPFSWALGAVKPIERLHAIRNLAITGKLNVELVQELEVAARAAGNLEDATKYANAIAKAQKEGKALTLTDRFAIAMTGGTPWLEDVNKVSKGKAIVNKINIFKLTPQAQASDMLDIVAANVGEYLVRPNWNADPEQFLAKVASAARGSIGGEWGHLAGTLQGRTVQAFLGKSDAAMKVMAAEWSTYAKERKFLGALKGLMPDKSEYQIYKMAKENPAVFGEKLAQLIGQPGAEWLAKGMQDGTFTPEFLSGIGKIADDIPLTREEFYAKALVQIQDVAMKQSIVQFGVKEKGMITKWADALKAWETLPFIKANPANAIRNVINNDVTLISRGLFGTMSDTAIKKFWDGQFVPDQLKRAFAFAGDEEFNAGHATKALVDTLEGSGTSTAQKVKKAAENVKLGVFDFSKFSQQMEAKASLRASTNGWIEFHNKYWNSKTGFTSVSKSFDPAMLDEMEEAIPGIGRLLDEAAESAGTDPAKFAKMMQSNIETSPATIFKNVEEKLGYKLDDVLGTEVSQTIKDGLPDAIANGRVHEFVNGVRSQMEAHVDDMFTKHLENLPGIVAAQVQAGGPLQYHRIFGKAIDEFWGGNTEHAIRMSTINEVIRDATASGDWKKVGSLWEKITADSDAHFGRVWKKFSAYQDGLKQGAKQAGIKYPDEVANSFKDMQKGWKSFFDTRAAEYKKFFDAKLQGKEYKKQFEQIQGELDSMYDEMIENEDRLYQQIDDLMTESLPDKTMQGIYKNFRDQSAKLRKDDRLFTQEFYKKVRTAEPGKAPDMWSQYWAERGARAEQIRQLEMRGSAAVQGDSASMNLFAGQQPSTGAEPQNVFELASRYNIPSASKTGKRNDRRILNTVNKYSKRDKVKLDTGVNAENIQPGQTFKIYRGEGNNVQGEAPGGDWWTTDINKAKKYGKVKEVTVKSEDIAGKYSMGHGGKDEFVFSDKKPDELSTVRAEYEKVDDIPMDVAQKAFDTRAGEKAQQATQAAEQSFIPDAEKLFPDPPPIETALSELNYGRGYSAIDNIIEESVDAGTRKSLHVKDLSPEVQKRVNQWMTQVEDEMSSFRAASVQYSSFRRDSALLNYNRRTQFDAMLGNVAPFAFWSTHSMFNWAIHTLDRPAMTTTYFRMRKLFETAGLKDQNVPTRLKGHIRIGNMPFVPDWMGDTFVNPMRVMLPFDAWLSPWEQMKSGNFSNEKKTQDTLQQMLEAGQITDDEYNDAINNKSGDAWDRAFAQVKEGGDSYDAMDFVNMTMTPHAPLMWAYNVARGQKSEIGPFTPMTRTIKNVATMMGSKDWSNSPYNIEGRVRKSMGLPAYDKWDDYRVGRMISNIAAEGKHPMEQIQQAMEFAAMVESGKMTSKDAVAQSRVYAEATEKANVESAGGWAGTVLGIFGIPLKSFPTGEEKQRALGDQFGAAIQAYEKGDVDALTNFFDEHPEYESRLALFKKPEERLKSFMVDHIWSRWNDLPKVNQDELKAQLGDNFANFFINKETRNYDSLSPLQLQVYLKLMGGKPVGTLSADQEVMLELQKIKLTDPETAWRVQTFYDMRNEMHGDWYKLQNQYYAQSTDAAKAKYLQQNPQLKGYWDARRDWMNKNPDLVRFLTDDPKQLKRYENQRRDPEVAVPTADEIRGNLSIPAQELIAEWGQGQNLPPSIETYMGRLAEGYGLTTQQMLGILTGQ